MLGLLRGQLFLYCTLDTSSLEIWVLLMSTAELLVNMYSFKNDILCTGRETCIARTCIRDKDMVSYLTLCGFALYL